MGMFDSVGKKIAHYGLELVMILLIFTLGLLVTIYATQAHSQCTKALNGTYGSISDADKQKYQSAKTNLQQVVWIGWTIVTLSIVMFIIVIIVGIVFSPEELGAAAAAGLEETLGPELAGEFSNLASYAKRAYSTGKDLANSLEQLNTASKRAKRGLYFHAAFGGVVTQVIFFAMLLTVFILGIFAAMASVKLGHTEGKYGQQKAQVAAIIGILPFSIFVVWFIADKVYSHMAKSSVEHKKEEIKEDAAKLRQDLARDGGTVPPAPVISHTHTTPVRSPTPAHHAPLSNTSSASSQFATTLANRAYDTGSAYISSPEGQQALSSAGKAIFSAAQSFLTS